MDIMTDQEKDDIPETQGATQSQSSLIWTNIESQPIEPVIWGRLYPKRIKIKPLDLCTENFSVGRAETNTLFLTKQHLPEEILHRVSKVHFSVKRELCDLMSPVYIQDCSRNGTFINGEKIGLNKTQILKNDDVISLYRPDNKTFVFKDLCPTDNHALPQEILSKYHVSRLLGNGACGVVRLVFDRKSCQKYAMKHVQKNLLVESSKPNIFNDPNRVINEANIMKSLQHPCVIKMHDIFDRPESVYMILEYMKGGDLLNRIIQNKRLSEEISKFFFYQMCHAVKYLHDQGITHRDLKPDNVLLESDDEETLLKVSDFGLSKFVHKDSVMRTLCGTPLYVAPEVLLTGGRGSYTKKVDIWSLGVVLFTCLSGTLPFSDDYGSPATEQIKRGRFNFSHPSWRNVSSLAKSLIFKMLTVNPNQRPSIDYVLRHKWLNQSNEMIKKANILLNISPSTNSDDENFLEPPIKRARR